MINYRINLTIRFINYYIFIMKSSKMAKTYYHTITNNKYEEEENQKTFDDEIQISYKKILEDINTEAKDYELLYNAFSLYTPLQKAALRMKARSEKNNKKLTNRTSVDFFNKDKHSKPSSLLPIKLEKKTKNKDNNLKVKNNSSSLKFHKNILTSSKKTFKNSKIINSTYSKQFLKTDSFPISIKAKVRDYLNLQNDNNNKNLYENIYNYKKNKSRNDKNARFINNTECKNSMKHSSTKTFDIKKKHINIFDYYNSNTLKQRDLSEKNENIGEFKFVYDIKRINDINEKVKNKMVKSKFRHEVKDKHILKRINLCKKKLMSVNLDNAINENIKKLIKAKNNNINGKKNIKSNINFIKVAEKNTIDFFSKVNERKLKEKIFINNAEDIMLKRTKLVYDVNKIDKRLNYLKFLHDNPV